MSKICELIVNNFVEKGIIKIKDKNALRFGLELIISQLILIFPFYFLDLLRVNL